MGRGDPLASVRGGDLLHNALGASLGRRADVREHESDGSRRESVAPPAPQPVGEHGCRRIAARGVGREVGAHDALERRYPLVLDRAPGRRTTRQTRAGEERDRSGRERVHVRRRRRPSPCCDLGRHVAGRACAAQLVGGRRGQPEVDEDHAPGGREDQICGLYVAVHHGRVVAVQVLESLGRLLQIADRKRRIEPRRALHLQHRLEVRAVDPVHRDDVALVHEEVLTDERKTEMRREGEKEPRLREQTRARGVVTRGPDLQRHLTTVEMIESADHLGLSSSAHDLERLVPLTEKLRSHDEVSHRRAGRPASRLRVRPRRSRAGPASARPAPRRT